MAWNGLKSRFPHSGNFWGVVDPDGAWIDSSTQFATAVHWACMDAGYTDLTPDEELRAVNRLGYSIIRSTHLKQMADAGLVK